MIRTGVEAAAAEGPGGIVIPGLVGDWPDRATASAWLEHIPFAFWLAHALRPRRFVELGTHTGASYCAFLQAFAALGLTTTASAVDTWQGDDHSGRYDDAIYEDLRAYTSSRYAATAELLRMTFDAALPQFEDHSIDLLHIDGFHSFEAVSHDFETWRRKLSPSAVVLFHDTQVHEPGFGVWRFWQHLASTTPHFEFHHGYGLGVAILGSECPPALHGLANLSGDDVAEAEIRNLFRALGERISARVQQDHQQAAALRNSERWDAERERARTEVERAAATIAAHEELIRRQAAVLEEQAAILDRQGRILHEHEGILREQGRIIDEQAALIAERDRALVALTARPS